MDINVIIEADGPIYFAGDTASHIVGWQEGAALSACRAVGMICEKVKAAKFVGRRDLALCRANLAQG